MFFLGKKPLLSTPTRVEKDSLGEMDLPKDALYGIHTARAIENFPLSRRGVHAALIHAFGEVKLASAQANRACGAWEDDARKAAAIETACREMARGDLDAHVCVDALQGGAGTSTNMNVNEVLANRALQICEAPLGSYARISPLDDINLHQSTNDAYPTAMKLAVIRQMDVLKTKLTALSDAFREKERAFAHILKLGRTQLQDAVPTTLGHSMGAFAAALARDAERVEAAQKSLYVVNLGGTAIGTGIAASRAYIDSVVPVLAQVTGVPFVVAADRIDGTQNVDVFAFVAGVLKACAVNYIKITTDLRLLASGPESGFGEILLPARQAGSSIMPGKVNPVIPEAAAQAAMRMIGFDAQIAYAASAGNLELNAFLPLVADSLLDGMDLLGNAADILREKCIDGMRANEERCRKFVEGSTALVTALVPALGYVRAAEVAKKARVQGKSIRQVVLDDGLMPGNAFDNLISAMASVKH